MATGKRTTRWVAAATGEFSGDRLRGHRHGQGLTAELVADRVGITVEALTRYERHFRESDAEPPSPALRDALARALGVADERTTPRGVVEPADDFAARYDADDPNGYDYVDAVCSHAPPLTEEQLQGAAEVLYRIRRDRARREQAEQGPDS